MLFLWIILGISVAVYTAGCGYLYFNQKRMIFKSTRTMYRDPGDLDMPFDSLTLTTSDGVKIHAWHIFARESGYDPVKTILFFHGNAGNMADRLETMMIYHQLGFNVLMIDYRGYGQSEGEVSEAGTYLDGEAAWRYLTERCMLQPEDIIVLGRSLGGGIATKLCTKVSPGGLILESTFTSMPAVSQDVFRWFPTRYLVKIHYNNLARLPDIRVPILIIHSKEDEYIPYKHGTRLYAAETPHAMKTFLQIHGNHGNGFMISGRIYSEGIKRFVDSLVHIKQRETADRNRAGDQDSAQHN